MTLDEAIKHCHDKAEEILRGLEDAIALGGQNPSKEEIADCEECANEHEQLANWLEELKEWREYGDRVKKAVQAVLDIQEVEQTRDEIKGMELFNEISKWFDNHIVKGEWVVKNNRPVCSRCGGVDSHMRLICPWCQSVMKSYFRTDDGKFEYRYPTVDEIREVTNGNNK